MFTLCMFSLEESCRAAAQAFLNIDVIDRIPIPGHIKTTTTTVAQQ